MCEFCRIITNQVMAVVYYQDDEVMVIRNKLDWVPIMLLVIPKKHMSQEEMWQNPIIAKLADIAVNMGKEYCPEGFRILSNFGKPCRANLMVTYTFWAALRWDATCNDYCSGCGGELKDFIKP